MRLCGVLHGSRRSFAIFSRADLYALVQVLVPPHLVLGLVLKLLKLCE